MKTYPPMKTIFNFKYDNYFKNFLDKNKYSQELKNKNARILDNNFVILLINENFLNKKDLNSLLEFLDIENNLYAKNFIFWHWKNRSSYCLNVIK